MFTNLDVDLTINTDQKFFKKPKITGEREFLPSNSYPKRRVFSEYPYKLPEIKDPNEKINKLISKDFKIEMGFWVKTPKYFNISSQKNKIKYKIIIIIYIFTVLI